VRGLVVAGSDAPGLSWAFAQCPEFGEEIFAEVPDYTHKIVWKRRPKTLDDLRGQPSATGRRSEPRPRPPNAPTPGRTGRP